MSKANKPRIDYVRLRLTTEEKKKLIKLAKSEGLTMSEYIRMKVLSKK